MNVLIADGTPQSTIESITSALRMQGVHPVWLASHMGNVTIDGGNPIEVMGTFMSYPSVLSDGVIIADAGRGTMDLVEDGDAKRQVMEAYKHLKPIALVGPSHEILSAVGLENDFIDEGVALGSDCDKVLELFLIALRKHRIWSREDLISVIPA